MLTLPAAHSRPKELLDLPEFTSKNEFLHQAQRRFTTVVHNRNWLALALELRDEGSAKSALPCRGRRKTGGGKAQAKWAGSGRSMRLGEDKQGLGCLGTLYSHPHKLVLRLTSFPEGRETEDQAPTWPRTLTEAGASPRAAGRA